MSQHSSNNAPIALWLASPFLAVLASFALPADSAPTGSQDPEPIHLVVLHTNDIHGQALPRKSTVGEGREVESGGLERVAEYVAMVRSKHTGPNRGLLVVDGGDWWQGTPEGALEGGLPFVKALGAVGYDALAIGNHEFDLGVEPLERMLEEVGLPAVMSNVLDAPEGEPVDWVEPFRVVETGGLRVALVGFISTDTPFITHRDSRRLAFVDEAEALERVLEELPAEVDLVVPLTHSGTDADRRLAEAHPELELIVGGHSHTFLRTGMRVGDTLIVQSGAKAATVGRVDLWIDPESGAVVDKTARLIELDRALPDERANGEVAERVAALAEASEAALGRPLGVLAGPLIEAERFRSSSVGNWIADSFRTGVESDVAIHNRGGIRKRLQPGTLTRRDLFELLPFPNTLVRIYLTGAELEACVRGALVGRETTRLEVSGMQLSLILDDEGRVAEVEVSVDGAPIDAKRTYGVATNSYLAEGGDRLFDLPREPEKLDTGILLRDLLERDLLEADGPFEPAADDRYAVRRGR